MIDTQASRQRIFNKLQRTTDKPDEEVTSQRRGHLSDKSQETLCDHFCRVLTAHHAAVKMLDTITDLPAAVAEHLNQLIASPLVYGGDNPMFNTLAWSRFELQWQESPLREDGQTAIASADYGIADTGTLVLLSSNRNPTRNNFLAEHHIIVLKRETILPYSEDVWEKLLANNADNKKALPRAVNFISGPSSSADVGLKLEYGAHGPRSLAVFIIQ